jgi:alanine racemase
LHIRCPPKEAFTYINATLSGLIAHPFHTQGRRQNTPPTLGFVMQRLRRCCAAHRDLGNACNLRLMLFRITVMQINQSVIAIDSGVRATWAEINLARLDYNLAAIKRRVSPSKVMLTVKANAYGHGLVEVSKALAGKTDYIGVAVLEEGILLRRIGITAPIIVLGGIWREQIPFYLQHNLTLTASSVERLEQIDEVARQMGIKAKVHLKIDTGMERIGIHYYSAHLLQESALKCAHVEVEGIFSHLANADSPDLAHARMQLDRFSEVLRFYERRSLPMPIRHIANSAAILGLPESCLDMVRPGILLYGVYPSQNLSHILDVKPALTWKSRVVYFKVVKPGHPVSYGSTWQSGHEVRIVTIPVGYGDGYFRSMSNRAQVMIRGKKYHQVGSICMDQMMVNIEWDSAYNGDEVILLDEAGGEKITVENLAEWAGTIPYEILTNINTRVPRVYVE